MFVIMATLLMISFRASIGFPGLLGGAAGPHRRRRGAAASNSPLGFVALLGVLALVGILIRNSGDLILARSRSCVQRNVGMEGGVEATRHRMRPIMLTAAAATLAPDPDHVRYSGVPWPTR